MTDALVLSAPFDSTNSERVQFARPCLGKGKRIAEEGGDAVILLDSMQAFVRAAEKVCSDEESGMLECKKFFASARRRTEAVRLPFLPPSTLAMRKNLSMPATVSSAFGRLCAAGNSRSRYDEVGDQAFRSPVGQTGNRSCKKIAQHRCGKRYG